MKQKYIYAFKGKQDLYDKVKRAFCVAARKCNSLGPHLCFEYGEIQPTDVSVQK
jgi:hypothetical protein